MAGSGLIGRPLRRSEDARLLRGLGRYTADLAGPEAARMVVLRSPHAAARIRAIRTAAAAAIPGVRLILTPEDPDIAALGAFASRVTRIAPGGGPNFVPPYRSLSFPEARFVGDAVAAVVADTLAAAQDAAEAIEVDWEVLPAAATIEAATSPGAPLVWAEAPGNICFIHEQGPAEAVSAALAAAPHRITLSYPISRVTAAPMETRAALARYDAAADRYTLIAPLQNPHFIREEYAGRVLGIPGHRLRVIAPDVGGAFGLKESHFPELGLALVAARRLGQEVLWVASRSEGFLGDHHARDMRARVTIGVDGSGTLLALRYECDANLGAYLSWNGTHVPTNNLGGLSGVYRCRLTHARVRGVFSHSQPTSPYRGAGRPEATYAIERALDLAAEELGLAPWEIRERNLIPPEAMPWDTGFAFTYDCGDFPRNQADALALADLPGLPARRAAAAARGRLLGFGMAQAIEIANGPITGPLAEAAEIAFDATGAATVTLGIHAQGQGHVTTFTQIAADLLGLPPEALRIRFGDTEQIEHGTGTFGSRSVVAAGAALSRAAEGIIARARRIAALALECAEADLAFAAGRFCVAGTDRGIDLPAVARLSYAMSPARLGTLGLAEKAVIAPSGPSFPNGCHACEVEVDPETGAWELTRYVVVDDVGRVINPMLVKGQIQGGVAQGLGQMQGEAIRHDAAGQLLTASFMDYALPRAADLPAILCRNNEVPTALNPLGAKGAGEAGTVGALVTVANALADALRPFGVRQVDMPATPEAVWRCIQAARSGAA